jgi:uncharacterized repeat protein (TIGR01451 family)
MRQTSLARIHSSAVSRFLIVIGVMVFMPPSTSAQQVATDKLNYDPGEKVTITGWGWKSNEKITLTINDTFRAGPEVKINASTGPEGTFTNQSFIVREIDRDRMLVLTALGASGAQAMTAFEDGTQGSLRCKDLQPYNSTHYGLKLGQTATCSIESTTGLSPEQMDDPSLVQVLVKDSVLGSTPAEVVATGKNYISFKWKAPDKACDTGKVTHGPLQVCDPMTGKCTTFPSAGNNANSFYLNGGHSSAGFAYLDSRGKIIPCGDVPRVVVSKVADRLSVKAGDDIGFTILVQNNGSGTARGVTLTDSLPGGAGASAPVTWKIDFASGAVCHITGSAGSQVLKCGPADLATGKSITVHVKATTSIKACGTYDNKVNFTTSNYGSGSASATISCNNRQPNLKITKRADKAIVNPGESIGFTITLTNSGPGTALGVRLSDNLPGGGTTPAVTWAIDQVSGATCNLTGAPGSQRLACGPVDLAAGRSITVRVKATTSAKACGVYDNTATYTATNSDPGRASASISCRPPSVCSISIDKKCEAPLVVTTPFLCKDAKPISELTVRWDGSVTVWIRAWNGKIGTGTPQVFNAVAPGQRVTFTRSGSFPNDVFFEVFTNAAMTAKLGESTFHLSCSDSDMDGPEDCGKAAGDGKGKGSFLNTFVFDGMAGSGQRLQCTPPESQGQDACQTTRLSPGCPSLGKPESLTFRFTNNSCAASSNQQPAGKWACSGTAGPTAAVSIIKDAKKIAVDRRTVSVGDLLTITADKSLGSETQLQIGGQTLTFHTSCSQPLAVGDSFGSLQLVAFNGQTAGVEVTYRYIARNSGSDANITIVDDPVGAIVTNTFLGSGMQAVFEKRATLFETTTNTATITATVAGPRSCSAKDSTTVTLLGADCILHSGNSSTKSKQFIWPIINAGSQRSTLTDLTITWPAVNGKLSKVKLDGDTMWDKPAGTCDKTTCSVSLPSSQLADKKKNGIDPGKTRNLVLEFEKNASTDRSAYELTVGFGNACSLDH